jgi:GNAT superfamily N-acetyltransferase
VIGGLIGRTNAIPEWLEVTVIWIQEEARGLGLGGQLMQRAEEEAKRRSCRYIRLSTSDFQSPDFYHKLGYKLYDKLDNCPRDEIVYFFSKELI